MEKDFLGDIEPLPYLAQGDAIDHKDQGRNEEQDCKTGAKRREL